MDIPGLGATLSIFRDGVLRALDILSTDCECECPEAGRAS